MPSVRTRMRSPDRPRRIGAEAVGPKLVDWDDPSVDAEAWLHFANGETEPALRMSKVDPQADFSYDYEDLAFTRVRGCP